MFPLRCTMIPRGLRVLLAATSAALMSPSQQVPARAEPQSDLATNATSARPKTEAKTPRASPDEICRTLAQAAVDNRLPVEFFTRIIWQESRFDPEAVSPKGAQGIAQFMPQTASGRGLTDPFEPLHALRESASYLRELRATFRGNLVLLQQPTMPVPDGLKHGSPVAADCRARREPMSASSRDTPPTPGRCRNHRNGRPRISQRTCHALRLPS